MILKGIEYLPDYSDHSAVYKFEDERVGLVTYIAVHKQLGNYPAFGATRYWNYPDENAAIKDVLRLSKGMSFKSALAGLPYGGAKAVIIKKDDHIKTEVLSRYCDFINKLGGKFITGADVGLLPADVNYMNEKSPYIVGVDSDPVKYTVLGIYCSMLSSVKNILGAEDLHDCSIAIQGLGKIGSGVLKRIYNQASAIYVTDIDNTLLDKIAELYPKVNVVPVSDILKLDVDILAPCALGGVITHRNVNDIKAKIVCGGANNQLESEDLAKKMLQNGVVYIPDYVVNAGGLISVVSEYEGLSEEDTNKKVENIYNVIDELFTEQRKLKIPLNLVAARWGADYIAKGQNV